MDELKSVALFPIKAFLHHKGEDMPEKGYCGVA